MPDAANLEVEHPLDALNPEGNGEIIGIGVPRRGGLLIGRRDEEPRRIRLEIEFLIDIEHDRPGVDRHPLGGIDECGRAAQRPQAERLCATGDSELIGPGAGRIDEYGRAQRSLLHPYLPRLAAPLQSAAALTNM